ncbi:MAG: hypothetical protein CVU84_02830 [Firmicutes bacterium HGW-Firmicutes-1]|jgi:hypothetical protein|nr:MAG: hypothetical protein CVU84_02830 [Firmicutes bacterium HGW-Firmicutes-1]
MQYLKRLLSLLLLVSLALINNWVRPNVSTSFSVHTILYCVINILLVLGIIVAYNLSKHVTKNMIVIIVDSVILIMLFIISFLPQIDMVLGDVLNNQFKISLKDINFIYYMQFIFGYWAITYVMILKNINIKRGNVISSIRYMGP